MLRGHKGINQILPLNIIMSTCNSMEGSPGFPETSSDSPIVIKSVCSTGGQSYLETLWNDVETADLTLGICGKTYSVHKLVLAQSPVLKAMLYGARLWKESSAHSIDLKEEEAYAAEAETFLKYLYGYEMAINFENVEPLLYFGDKYAMDGLVEDCLLLFEEQIQKNGDLQCALSSWKLIRRMLVSRSSERICLLKCLLFSNVELVMSESNLIQCMDLADVKTFLGSDKIVCRTEFSLYRKLLEPWLLNKEDKPERLSLFIDLCSQIRFCYMHIQELGYVESSLKRLFGENVSDSTYLAARNHLKVMLCDAYRYHLMPYTNASQWEELPPMRVYLDGRARLAFRLTDIYALSSWSKIEHFFEVSPSMSAADKLRCGFRVTLMRKINAGSIGSLQALNDSKKDKRKSLLSLEITQLMTTIALPYTRGLVYVHENRNEKVLRKHLTTFEMAPAVRLADILSYGEIVKDSLYRYETEAGTVHLALDIVLIK